jgi:hypothetical protein
MQKFAKIQLTDEEFMLILLLLLMNSCMNLIWSKTLKLNIKNKKSIKISFFNQN